MLHREPGQFLPPPMPDNISVVGASPALRPETVDVVVTLPTFRRPAHLVATLESLSSQNTARRFAVVVMENDEDGQEGAAAAMLRLSRGDLPGIVIIAHDRGNCSAYNAGWLTALEVFPSFSRLLVIDDDELADVDWLENMCSAAERLEADIVGGPQLPVFENPAHAKWSRHPVFGPAYTVSGVVDILYSSGNLLLSRRVLETMGPPFLDLRFNFTGGGDSDFLSRAAARGFRLAWCNEAMVRETVPARRVEWSWVQARSLRNGVLSTLVEKKKRAHEPFGALRVVAKSLALLAASPLRAALQLARTRSLAIASYPVLGAMGRIMAEFGYANEQYRNPESN